MSCKKYSQILKVHESFCCFNCIEVAFAPIILGSISNVDKRRSMWTHESRKLKTSYMSRSKNMYSRLFTENMVKNSQFLNTSLLNCAAHGLLSYYLWHKWNSFSFFFSFNFTKITSPFLSLARSKNWIQPSFYLSFLLHRGFFFYYYFHYDAK